MNKPSTYLLLLGLVLIAFGIFSYIRPDVTNHDICYMDKMQQDIDNADAVLKDMDMRLHNMDVDTKNARRLTACKVLRGFSITSEHVRNNEGLRDAIRRYVEHGDSVVLHNAIYDMRHQDKRLPGSID